MKRFLFLILAALLLVGPVVTPALAGFFSFTNSDIQSPTINRRVADLVTLKATTGNSKILAVHLMGGITEGDGREGDFRWLAGDQSANAAVLADPQEGDYVKLTVPGDGSTGVWVRIRKGPADIREYGALGTPTNDTVAIQAALNSPWDIDLSDGTYLSGVLTLNNATDKTITFEQGANIVVTKPDFDGGTADSAFWMVANNSTDITFVNLQVSANAVAPKYIKANGCSNFKFIGGKTNSSVYIFFTDDFTGEFLVDDLEAFDILNGASLSIGFSDVGTVTVRNSYIHNADDFITVDELHKFIRFLQVTGDSVNKVGRVFVHGNRFEHVYGLSDISGIVPSVPSTAKMVTVDNVVDFTCTENSFYRVTTNSPHSADSGNTGTSIVAYSDCDSVNVSGNEFDGIDFGMESGGDSTKNVRITNNLFRHISEHGIDFVDFSAGNAVEIGEIGDTGSMLFQGNTIEGGFEKCTFRETDQLNILGNTWDGVLKQFISIVGNGKIIIDGNIFGVGGKFLTNFASGATNPILIDDGGGKKSLKLIWGLNHFSDISTAIPINSAGAPLMEGLFVPNDSVPAKGTWQLADSAPLLTPTAGGTQGYICINPGTFGTLVGVTGTTISGNRTVVVNSTADLAPNMWIRIAGFASPLRIDYIDEATLTLFCHRDIGSSLAGAAVSYEVPAFKTYGVIAP